MLKIGEFSKLSRISIRMLRHYDQIGLLTPKKIDNDSGYRYYGEGQLLTAGRIAELKDMGFGLAAMGEIMRNYEDARGLEALLKGKREEISEEAEEAKRRLRLLDTAMERLRKDETAMEYNVTLKTLPQRYVASVRMVIPSYEQEGNLWHIMMEETAPFSLRFAEPCSSLAIFHDEGFKEENVDVEIQVTVKGQYSNTEHVIFKTAPEVEIASAIYTGSYDQITGVNIAVANWMDDNGYEFNGPMFCIYHMGPAQTQNPEEWVTEVCFPVKKR